MHANREAWRIFCKVMLKHFKRGNWHHRPSPVIAWRMAMAARWICLGCPAGREPRFYKKALRLYALMAALVLLALPAYAQEVATSDRVEICSVVGGQTYSQRHRHTSRWMKAEVYRKAGVDPEMIHARDSYHRPVYEVDHIVPLAAGGADTLANLVLQPGTGMWNYHVKDELEAEAKRRICSKGADPIDVQKWFIGDWREAYKQVFGTPIAQ